MKFHQLPLLKTIQLNSENWLSSPGVIGTFVLIFIIIFLGVFIFLKRLNRYVDFLEKNTTDLTEEEFQRRLINLEEEDVDNILELRQQGFKTNVKPSNIAETSSKYIGFIKKVINPKNPLFDEKTKSAIKIEISKELKNIIIWYLSAAVVWLIFGTLVGQYMASISRSTSL